MLFEEQEYCFFHLYFQDIIYIITKVYLNVLVQEESL